MTRLSEHFTTDDLRCNCKACGGSLRMSLVLVGVLEEIRAYYERRINILAGYRCEGRIKELGRSRKSYHALGKAVDIKIPDIDSKELFDFCRHFTPPIKGLGYYPDGDFVHIDMREVEKRFEFVYFNRAYNELTQSLATQYGLKAIETTPVVATTA